MDVSPLDPLVEAPSRRAGAYCVEVGGELHGGCFYGRRREGPEHRPLVERAWRLVERLALK